MSDLIKTLSKNLGDVLQHALRMEPGQKSLVIFDTQSDLARIFTEAYRAALPDGNFVDFDSVTVEDVKKLFDECVPGDLVVLVQSTNFRLDEFRARIELFKRGLKTIEHVHLNRMVESQFEAYVDELAYDPAYYRPLGRALKAKLDAAPNARVECDGTKLVYDGPMEGAKMNIGDYTDMKNTGGTFPIGEVFTEPKDLRRVNGNVRVFAFAGEDFIVRTFDPPFCMTIKDGVVTDTDGPQEFQDILAKIREDEEVMVREFGLGLNPAVGKSRVVNDITAFERQKGLHFSLGAKHGIYAKPGINRKQGRYHVDIFIDAKRILLGEEAVYEKGEFLM